MSTVPNGIGILLQYEHLYTIILAISYRSLLVSVSVNLLSGPVQRERKSSLIKNEEVAPKWVATLF